jgi:hypothetical protein
MNRNHESPTYMKGKKNIVLVWMSPTSLSHISLIDSKERYSPPLESWLTETWMVLSRALGEITSVGEIRNIIYVIYIMARE